jgi:predicted HNH restriction endonuclease
MVFKIIAILFIFFNFIPAEASVKKQELFTFPGWVSKIKVSNSRNVAAMIIHVNEDVYYSCSSDKGNTWSNYKRLNKNDSTAADVVIDEEDNIYLFWIEHINNGAILILRVLANNCKDVIWEQLITNNLTNQSDIIARIKNNKLAIAYSRLEGDKHSFILKISENRGRKWHQEKVIHQIYSKNWTKIILSGWIDFDIGDDGNIYLAGIKRNKWSNGVFFTILQNDGNALLKPIMIRRKTLAKNCQDCILHSPERNIKIFLENKSIYIFYIITKGDKNNLYGTYSEDGGLTWSKPILLTNKFSFVSNYSIFINKTHIDGLIYREDKKIKGLYYAKLGKNSIGDALYSFLFDNIGVAVLTSNEEKLNIISSVWENENKISKVYKINLDDGVDSKNDKDKDNIPDEFEDKLLKKFKPHWHINADDPAGIPVRLKENSCSPEIEDKDSTIYGQVFRLNKCTEKICEADKCECIDYYSLEVHYYNIWEDDKLVWPFSLHEWDTEHISARAIHNGIANPDCKEDYVPTDLSELLWQVDAWHVDRWEFYAHEGTPCEKEKKMTGFYTSGIEVWVSYKHGIFPNKLSCNKFLRFWCPDACFGDKDLGSPDPINIGEVFYPLNGALWASCSGFLINIMDPDLPTFQCNY